MPALKMTHGIQHSPQPRPNCIESFMSIYKAGYRQRLTQNGNLSSPPKPVRRLARRAWT